MDHLIEPRLLERRVRVALVGVGGNGAQMATCLARLDIAMRALGHPGGLHVTAFDPDAVAVANVGRQHFSPSDVGQNKAVLTIHRLNQFYVLDWAARPWQYGEGRDDGEPDILVSCVDSRASRRVIHRSLSGSGTCRTVYWLDLGNTESTAQAILGEPPSRPSERRVNALRLPCVTELFPELLDERIEDDNTPSCSVRMSLASQGLFVNDVVVRFAAQLLYELFSRGKIDAHGVVINLASKRTAPVDVNPDVWQRYGFGVGRKARQNTRERKLEVVGFSL